MIKEYQLPFIKEQLAELQAGTQILLTGIIYTARDAAHKRLIEALERDEELPLPIEHSIIYYVGPTPARPNHAVGSAGPTTSTRMDAYAPTLYDLGMSASIGKGRRTAIVKEAIQRNKAVYFVTIGGAGAYLSECIKEAEVIAYEDLGAEAIYKLRVEKFPVIVGIDSTGTDVYEK